MTFQLHPYVLHLAITAIICGIALVIAWQRRSVQGAAQLSLIMLGLMIWSAAYALLWASATEGGQLFWMNVLYIGVNITPISFFVFVARLTKANWVKPIHIILLGVISLVSLLILWTNGLHHFFFTAAQPLIRNGLLEIEWVRGPWWWVNLSYSYGLLLGGIVLLLREFKRAGLLQRSQLLTILIGALIPWAVNVVYQFWFVRLTNLDLTPVAFSISCFFFAYAIFTQGLFDFLPIARSLLVEKIKDGIVVLDEKYRVIDVNPSAEKALRINAKEILGHSALDVFPEWADLAANIQQMDVEFHTEVQGRTNTDRRYDLSITSFDVDVASGKGYLVIFRDITHHWDTHTGLQELNQELASKLGEINALQEELREQAIRDALTGAYNRRFLDESLQSLLAKGVKDDHSISIIMMDIDNFKEINDIYGHIAGDLVLQKLAGLTQSEVRDGDLVCRYGGDEFVIILPKVSDKVAAQRAEQVRKKVESVTLDYKSINLKVTSSMGIAVGPRHGSSADLLLRAADKALYASKLAGRNRVTIFDPHGNMNTIRLKMPPK